MATNKTTLRGRLKKLLLICGVAVITFFFLQFSSVSDDYNENLLIAKKQLPPFLIQTTSWSDSLCQELSVREKIGQMIMVASYPDKGNSDKKQVAELIKNNKIGGVIFFQGTPEKIAELSQYYQSISNTPLLIAIDGEWGLAMRLQNTIRYPRQLTLGAITDEMQIYKMGSDIAEQLKQIGIHVNFAPVVDVNNNPDNPVINSRSFGDNRVNVARKGLLYMRGMQDAGVLAFAKHFPGHGDTKTDSHYGLPIIDYSSERLDSLELYPFRALINAGVGGVMVAHMNVLSLDSTSNLPSTLSPMVIDSVLLSKMAFEGLVVTDAMNMKGITDYFSPVEANLKAVQAGNDIILMPTEVEKTIDALEKSIKEGLITEDRINKSCHKILKAKEWAIPKAKHSKFSIDSLHKPKYYLNRKQLFESALTVIKNEEDLLPLKKLETLKIATISIGKGDKKEFNRQLDLYLKTDEINLEVIDTNNFLPNLHDTLKNYNLVILSLHSDNKNASGDFGFSKTELALIDSLLIKHPSILVNFTSPYVLSRIKNLDNSLSILLGYENDSIVQNLMAQLIFGAIGSSGVLPVTINNNFTTNTGIKLKSINRFEYVSPYEAGFDVVKLEKIDSIVADAIQKRAMPGCQVLAAKDGKVFFNKTYGFHTYQKRKPVTETDIYDLASLTKVLATLPSVMKLDGMNKIDINKKLSDYLPYLDTCDKGDIVISDVLLHQAGLAAWIPFYWSVLEPVYPDQDLMRRKYSESYSIKMGPRVYANTHLVYKENYFSHEYSVNYPFQVIDKLYLRWDLSDTIWHKIIKSKLGERGHYKYSDLGFYIMHKIIVHETNRSLEYYADSVFYGGLGASYTGFNPLYRFDKSVIIPTENDLVFRKQLVHGFVHDPGAAMLGGVSGHAGLFGNANDVAKIMQMYMNGGRYGDKVFINRKTINKYTRCFNCENGNRRGLGFDKPQPDTNLPGPVFKGISTDSYGHSGFTGTLTWADPETGILYVFLSNRIYPDSQNKALIKMNVRTKIHQTIYSSMLSK